jgi:hypothetical protein
MKVYIVSDGTYLLGVHKTKKGALATKKRYKNHQCTGVYIKRRVDTVGYLNIQE